MRVWPFQRQPPCRAHGAVCAVAAAGDGPIRQLPEPYVPSRPELIEIGAITSEYPIPGQLPPRIPPEAYGLGLPGPPTWLWWLLGAIAAAALAWVAAPILRELMRIRWRPPRLRRWRWRWRGRAPTAPDESCATEPAPVADDDEAEVAPHAVDAALVPLRDAADPRAAVIESYARMEHVLAERELRRRTPEAPREYLRRVLREQGMPEESLTTLTALFEEARFSRHPIPRGRAAPRRERAPRPPAPSSAAPRHDTKR